MSTMKIKEVRVCRARCLKYLLVFAISMATCLMVEKTIGQDDVARNLFMIAVIMTIALAGLVAISDKIAAIYIITKWIGISFVKTSWLIATKQQSQIRTALSRCIQEAPKNERRELGITMAQLLRILGFRYNLVYLEPINNKNPESF